MANLPTAQLVSRCLCVMATATFLWMTSSNLQPRIWSMISGRNQMMMVRHGAHIQEASQQQTQAFYGLNGGFKRWLSDSSDTLKSIENVILVFWAIKNKALVLIRMRLCYVTMITLWVLTLQAFWPIECVQAATLLQISRCEDGMHWLHSCSRICVVGG